MPIRSCLGAKFPATSLVFGRAGSYHRIFKCSAAAFRPIHQPRRLPLAAILSAPAAFTAPRQLVRHSSLLEQREKINRQEIRVHEWKLKLFSWFTVVLALCPLTCFGLAIWQYRRSNWKRKLIRDMESRSREPPLVLGDDFEYNEEYQENNRFRHYELTGGEFLYDKEVYVGPRMCGLNDKMGYFVVTPFQIAGPSGTRVLVNRGMVSVSSLNSMSGVGKEDAAVTAILHRSEEGNWLIPVSQPKKKMWYIMVAEELAEYLDAVPALFKVVAEPNNATPGKFAQDWAQGRPIRGETEVEVRNAHFEYLLFWTGLGLCTSYMFYATVRQPQARTIIKRQLRQRPF